jgi:hypothetical protein
MTPSHLMDYFFKSLSRLGLFQYDWFHYTYRTCMASRWLPTLSYVGNQENREDKEFLSFICEKQVWELLPNILVIRNPNWS